MRYWHITAVALIGAAQAALLAHSAPVHSPCIDETGHLAAGLHHWRTGTFDLYRVNPPLVRIVATWPLEVEGVVLPLVSVSDHPLTRPEFALGEAFFARHGEDGFRHCVRARLACIPFALLGTLVVYLWASGLYGRVAGVTSAALWAFHPFALAHAELICPDTAATSFGLLACYAYWIWSRTGRSSVCLGLGLALGLSLLCKTTWLVLYPAFLLLLLLPPSAPQVRLAPMRRLFHFLAAVVVSVVIVNTGYGFEGSFTPLQKFTFISQALTREEPDGRRINAFAGTTIGRLPVPFPSNFVSGIDVQRSDFEFRPPSYFAGQWRRGGWWSYYVTGLFLKTPPTALLLFVGAVCSLLVPRLFPRPAGVTWRDEVTLLVPACTLLVFVSSQTGFNHHLRYVLPALPALVIFTGRLSAYGGRSRCVVLGLIGLMTAGSAYSLARVYPHQLAYFNRFAGGPLGGGDYYVDSNLDWGQDLLLLKAWVDSHPDIGVLGLAYHGNIDPRVAGLTFDLPPTVPTALSDLHPDFLRALGPRPGWYAVSVSILRGKSCPIPTPFGSVHMTTAEDYTYFANLHPVATAGYSIYIYHIDESTCDRLRFRLGLPPFLSTPPREMPPQPMPP